MDTEDSIAPPGPANSAPTTTSVELDIEIQPARYREMTGEDLKATLDISTWDTGVRALQAFERLEREVEEAVTCWHSSDHG